MYDIVEDHGENQFANRQSSRDLRRINRATEVNSEMEASSQEHGDIGIKVVNARLNYLAEATPKPVNYAYDPPAGVPGRSGKYLAQTVAIRNGRELLSKFSLDTNGFVLTEHETAVKD